MFLTFTSVMEGNLVYFYMYLAAQKVGRIYIFVDLAIWLWCKLITIDTIY